MPLCNINLLGNNLKFDTNQEKCISSNFSIENSLNEEFILQASKSNENLPCQILLVDGPNIYDLSQPITFNSYLSFYIRVILNGTQESFIVDIKNVSCNNETVMKLNLIYEG